MLELTQELRFWKRSEDQGLPRIKKAHRKQKLASVKPPEEKKTLEKSPAKELKKTLGKEKKTPSKVSPTLKRPKK
jgi:hypothetical protein